MFEKFVFVNINHVIVVFEDRHINVHTDNGTAVELADELLAPFTHNFSTHSDYCRALESSEEDTVIINREELVKKDIFGTVLMLGLTTVVILTIVYAVEAIAKFNEMNVTAVIGF